MQQFPWDSKFPTSVMRSRFFIHFFCHFFIFFPTFCFFAFIFIVTLSSLSGFITYLHSLFKQYLMMMMLPLQGFYIASKRNRKLIPNIFDFHSFHKWNNATQCSYKNFKFVSEKFLCTNLRMLLELSLFLLLYSISERERERAHSWSHWGNKWKSIGIWPRNPVYLAMQPQNSP